jgi:hypothetical protein
MKPYSGFPFALKHAYESLPRIRLLNKCTSRELTQNGKVIVHGVALNDETATDTGAL